MEENKKILDEYHKFDYLSPKIKILVGYIKPAFLFKTEILTPVHLGKKVAKENSKDGIISDNDLEWLSKNCITDDDFEGSISQFNRRVGFLTGIYKAWKIFEDLNNPDYFGNFGYRRLLLPNFLKDFENYDLILPKKKKLHPMSLKEQFINYHGKKLFEVLINVFQKKYSSQINDLENYLNGFEGYFDEIYVMKKDLFFDFCEWIFPLLFEFLNLPQIILPNNDLRDIGFIIERLTGFYLNNLTLKNIKFKEEEIFMAEKMVIDRKNIDLNLLMKLRNKNLCTK